MISKETAVFEEPESVKFFLLHSEMTEKSIASLRESRDTC